MSEGNNLRKRKLGDAKRGANWHLGERSGSGFVDSDQEPLRLQSEHERLNKERFERAQRLEFLRVLIRRNQEHKRRRGKLTVSGLHNSSRSRETERDDISCAVILVILMSTVWFIFSYFNLRAGFPSTVTAVKSDFNEATDPMSDRAREYTASMVVERMNREGNQTVCDVSSITSNDTLGLTGTNYITIPKSTSGL
ncbi:hypothetical protein TWF718_005744 [Orbilia javanica]|uniref:Uncharacterized protein n=1 Tax=Orbilia javanica TaxID=47235 RepID=A0AAN8MVL3_9PEZI